MVVLVPTELRQSGVPGAGLGLFTLVDIPKGGEVWKYDPDVDFAYTIEEYKKQYLNADGGPGRYSAEELEKFWWHCYWDVGLEKLCLCGDNGGYVNHNDNNNVGDDDTKMISIALRDIKAGEELFDDYRDFTREREKTQVQDFYESQMKKWCPERYAFEILAIRSEPSSPE